MKIAPRSSWTRLRLGTRGRTVVLARRVLAAALFVVAAVLAARPTAAGPAPPAATPVPPPSNSTIAPGFATVPVRLADPGVAELLGRGMRVDVVTAEAGEPNRKVLASMATVVDVRSPPRSDAHLLSEEGKGPLVLISVPVEVATQVAAVSLRNPVAITFR